MAIPTDLSEEARNTQSQPALPGIRWYTRVIRAFRQDPRMWFGVVLLVFVIAAIFAPFVSPYPPLLYHPAVATQGPTLAHLLGTDALGRDQLSRVIYGTRISLSVGIITILLGGVCGTLLGLLAAYFKGWVDQLITIVVDALLSFPSLVLALAIVAALGPGIINLALALAVVRIPIYARLARGQTLQVTAQDYVTSARAAGSRTPKILFRHILPNIFSPLLVQATISVSFAILDESVLSFLGLGIQPPTPEWGTMISDAQVYLSTDPWMMLGPALAIILVVVSLNLLGDALRDRLDPRDYTRTSTVAAEQA
ncbi:MAG TPA: ABC transporter permease [Ktedonobacteraceae bacterium]|nr:ABC transporter permease [Ktedonobacteraceae bacterium]